MWTFTRRQKTATLLKSTNSWRRVETSTSAAGWLAPIFFRLFDQVVQRVHLIYILRRLDGVFAGTRSTMRAETLYRMIRGFKMIIACHRVLDSVLPRMMTKIKNCAADIRRSLFTELPRTIISTSRHFCWREGRTLRYRPDLEVL